MTDESLEQAPGPYDDIVEILSALPRPRPVRMSRTGKIRSATIAAVLLVSLGIFAAGMSARAAAGNPRPPSLAGSALPILLVFGVAAWILRGLKRQRTLVSEGELVIGRVTKRWVGRKGENVRYEYTTLAGERFERSSEDASRQLNTGMQLPVFYDSQDPKKQLALCGSFYEVILPGRE